MAQERNLGVAEARVGLSIITCLLLVLGYVVLQRLGGTGQLPPVEFRSYPSADQVNTTPPVPDVDQPRVLKPEVWQPTQLPIQTSQRPDWLSPREDVDNSPSGLLQSIDTPPADVTHSPLELADPLQAGRTPDVGAIR